MPHIVRLTAARAVDPVAATGLSELHGAPRVRHRDAVLEAPATAARAALGAAALELRILTELAAVRLERGRLAPARILIEGARSVDDLVPDDLVRARLLLVWGCHDAACGADNEANQRFDRALFTMRRRGALPLAAEILGQRALLAPGPGAPRRTHLGPA